MFNFLRRSKSNTNENKNKLPKELHQQQNCLAANPSTTSASSSASSTAENSRNPQPNCAHSNEHLFLNQMPKFSNRKRPKHSQQSEELFPARAAPPSDHNYNSSEHQPREQAATLSSSPKEKFLTTPKSTNSKEQLSTPILLLSSRNEFVDHKKRIKKNGARGERDDEANDDSSERPLILENIPQNYKKLKKDQFNTKSDFHQQFGNCDADEKPESFTIHHKNNNNINSSKYENSIKKPNKSVKSFNPIDKSREFLNNIMAKGRNRHKNNNNSKQQYQTNSKHKSISGDQHLETGITDIPEFPLKNPSYKPMPNQYDDNIAFAKNQLIDSDNLEKECSNKINIGYQITKSKNSRDILKKIVNFQNDEPDDDDADDDAEPQVKTYNNKKVFQAEENSPTNLKSKIKKCAYSNEFQNDFKNRHEEPTNSPTTNKIPENNELRKPKSILKKTQHYWDRGESAGDREQLNSVNTSESNATDPYYFAPAKKTKINFIDNEEVDKLEKLSELAECDRDNFISQAGAMGQSQAKTPPTARHQRSRSTSPPPSANTGAGAATFTNSNAFNRDNQKFTYDYTPAPIVTEPLSPSSSFDKKSKEHHQNIPLPKITIGDYTNHLMDKSSPINDKNTSSPNDSEPEIFYEFDSSSSNKSNFPSSPPMTPTFLEDIVEEDENEEDSDADDDWHFVTAPQLPAKRKDFVLDSSLTPTLNRKTHSNNYNSDSTDSGFDSITNCETNTASGGGGKVLTINSCDLINDRESSDFLNKNHSATKQLRIENDYEYFNNTNNNLNIIESNSLSENCTVQHILIDSISLPDVVVESKVAAEQISEKLVNTNRYEIPQFVGPKSKNHDVKKSHSMGNVHFIPIHVEEASKHIENGIHDDDDGETVKTTKKDSYRKKSNHNDTTQQKRDLINQEASYNSKLEESQQTAYNAQQKANELQTKINDMEIDLSTKCWNIERLEAELEAIYKEDDGVRKRLKFLEKEKENLKLKFDEKEEEFDRKYEILQAQYEELDNKYQKLRSLASSLQTQLAIAQSDADVCRIEKDKLYDEKNEQLKKLEENLASAKREKDELEKKWQKEFETLRNQNQDREEHLLTDCEWQLRTMQKNCKTKLDKAEQIRNDAIEKNEELEEIIQQKTLDEKRFKTLQAEVRQLRGLTNDQMSSLHIMNQQIEELRADLEATNTELEDQIEEVRRIKLNCQNELDAKDRETVQKLYDAIQETADTWENKLLTEMTRLTHELDAVHAEERLDDMNKIQSENLEELRVLTNKYTENDVELRSQISDLKEKLENKSEVAFNTRMHLDRADRDYQIAMSREEEKKELLIEKLQKEFDEEKHEMEEKFRERLGQVKKEFAKELTHATEEITKRHRHQLEQQWDQLVADKEEALQALESRHRIRLEEQEAKIRNLEVQHKRDMKDLKNAYDMDRSSLQTRDMNNSQEIEQLHRKCRCLTNLFEEMRMRYERREPRPEDLREISELRSRCEEQERDLFSLTERLREMQIKMEEMTPPETSTKKSIMRKPPPKTIPTNCDVIYEENEEREVSPPLPKTNLVGSKLNGNAAAAGAAGEESSTDTEEDDDEDDDDEEDDDNNDNESNNDDQEN